MHQIFNDGFFRIFLKGADLITDSADMNLGEKRKPFFKEKSRKEVALIQLRTSLSLEYSGLVDLSANFFGGLVSRFIVSSRS